MDTNKEAESHICPGHMHTDKPERGTFTNAFLRGPSLGLLHHIRLASQYLTLSPCFKTPSSETTFMERYGHSRKVLRHPSAIVAAMLGEYDRLAAPSG